MGSSTDTVNASSPYASALFAYGGTVDIAPLYVQPDVFDLWATIPPRAVQASPHAQRLAHELLVWTGWSHRKLAGALGTSHPTVAALERGESTGKFGGLFDRIRDAHAVVERVHLLANRNATETDRLLSTAGGAGRSATDFLRTGRPADAYLTALDVARPRRSGGMMTGLWPAPVGNATVDLGDDAS